MLEDSVFGAERKKPELGAVLFLVSCKEEGVVLGEDSYGYFFKEYVAAVVT